MSGEDNVAESLDAVPQEMKEIAKYTKQIEENTDRLNKLNEAIVENTKETKEHSEQIRNLNEAISENTTKSNELMDLLIKNNEDASMVNEGMFVLTMVITLLTLLMTYDAFFPDGEAIVFSTKSVLFLLVAIMALSTFIRLGLKFSRKSSGKKKDK